MTALFTGKGDSGTTNVYGCDQKISKSSAIAEALGSLDEVNSFLGLPKMKAEAEKFYVGSRKPSFSYILHWLQEGLFIVQAEVAGAEKSVQDTRVKEMEEIIHTIEVELPPIHSFFISGGTELAATLDFARTLARRAERRVVEVSEKNDLPVPQNEAVRQTGRKISPNSLAFMNRLSSVLYALARLANHKSGKLEDAPSYE